MNDSNDQDESGRSDIDAELARMAELINTGGADPDPSDDQDHGGAAEDRDESDSRAESPPDDDDDGAITEPRAIRTVSQAVSWLATGAMVTVLALWATGVFDVPSIREIVLRADPPAERPTQAAPLTGAEVTEPEPTEPQTPPEPPPVVEVEHADPTLIEIPAIGVQASVIPLNTLPGGELEVPTDYSQTGWWEGGPEPGEDGPSVIVGHVDSVNGPAVFFGLEELVFDDAITVTRGDGSAAVFAVRSTLNVTKEEFPTDLVYGDTEEAELRLVTCDGGFADGSYSGNLIITAELVEERPPPAAGPMA